MSCVASFRSRVGAARTPPQRSTARSTTAAQGSAKRRDAVATSRRAQEAAPVYSAAPEKATMTSASAPIGPLLVVGPGVLGSYLGKLWIEAGDSVVGRTLTTSHHPRLTSLGFAVETVATSTTAKFPYVVFCAPPSGSDDYPASVAAAAESWDGTGAFVFTSSTAVYPQLDLLNEETPTLPLGGSPRVDRLIYAEGAVLEVGGSVVRLCGLYHSARGPHTALLKTGTSARAGNYPLQLIHYQDAANLVFHVLRRGGDFRGEIFLGVSRDVIQMQEIVDSAVASGKFSGAVEFQGDPKQELPKRSMDNSRTLQQLRGTWAPQFAFAGLMKSGGDDWYKTSGLW